jgi:hypothetical protein
VLGIGVDELVKQGHLDRLKGGPLYWVDTADSQPCIGTGGIACWQLTAHGAPHAPLLAILCVRCTCSSACDACIGGGGALGLVVLATLHCLF